MKVILQQDVSGQGKKGQLITVSDGYARNYLLPRKLAMEATADALNAIKLHDAAVKKRAEEEKKQAAELAERLKTLPVRVHSRAGAGGKLFGAVTSAEIADALKAQHGVELDKRRISIEEPIKQFGTYEVHVKLGNEISSSLYVTVSE